MLVLGTVINPKSTPLTGVQYVSVHCVLILVLGYITTEKDYTSEIIKIAKNECKAYSKRCSTCLNRLETTQLCFLPLLHPNPSGIIYVLTV